MSGKFFIGICRKMSGEISHLEIYGLLKELKAELDMSLKYQEEDRERADKERAEVFDRLSILEKRMAQVIILGIVFMVTIPVAVELTTGRLLHFGAPPQQSGGQLQGESIATKWTPPQPPSSQS